MWRSRWRCVIKPAYSVSFLLSINIFVWQNVLYFLDAPRTITISVVRRVINYVKVLFDACYRGSSGRLLVRWRAMKCCRYSCCHIIATSATKCWALTDWCCKRWCKTDTSWWQTLCWISTISLCRWVDNALRFMLRPSTFLWQLTNKYQKTHKLKQVATNFRFRYVKS